MLVYTSFKITVTVIRRLRVTEGIHEVIMNHHAKIEFPSAFHKKNKDVQSCIMSTLLCINIV